MTFENNSLESKYPQIKADDFSKLRQSVYMLEQTPLVIQVADWISNTATSWVPSISDSNKQKIIGIAENALDIVFNTANATLENKQQESSVITHKIMAGMTGALGGFFGFTAILAELPVSTTIMMRSILDIAREEGFSLDDPMTKIECIKVFGLEGNLSKNDDNAESGYYASRVGLNAIVQKVGADLIEDLVEIGAEKVTTSIISKLIQNVANKLGVTLSEKAIAQSIPIIGAVSGATLNIMFTDFYQDMAKGHFRVKNLEKRYSANLIKSAYEDIYREMKDKKLLQ